MIDRGWTGRAASDRGRLALVRFLLPAGWLLAAIGYYGPWIAHRTAALSLSGVDMGEFVKFLPGAANSSPAAWRQLFYLPSLAVVIGVALLIASRVLAYPWPVRFLALVGAVPLSLQLLPPAWSPASLLTPEFRLQALALALCWLLLAVHWLFARLPAWATSLPAALLALAATALPAWQMIQVKPAIDAVYGQAPPIGWGFYLCLLGLLAMALASSGLAWPRRHGGGRSRGVR